VCRPACGTPCLQVSTTDGRVKIFGREGVERTLRCGSGAPHPAARQLLFLVNRGAVLRVDEVGINRGQSCVLEAVGSGGTELPQRRLGAL
jgi:hypothetical protein